MLHCTCSARANWAVRSGNENLRFVEIDEPSISGTPRICSSFQPFDSYSARF
jgi:hypothetical protein